MMRALTLLATLTALSLLLTACGSDDANGDGDGEPSTSGVLTPLPEGIAATALSGGYPIYRDDETEVTAILGTPDLGVGRHRFGFVLTTPEGLVRLPVLTVESYRLPEGPTGDAVGPIGVEEARFYEFPFGTRGIYSVALEFDRAGDWSVRVSFPSPEGEFVTTEFAFEVAEATHAPDIGAAAPPSETRTLATTGSLAKLSTGTEPDAALYRLSIADALEADRPLVVVFASPAFCTNALCGPQVEVIGDLAADYEGRANFIHVDLYENPHEIQGDLSRAVRTPILEEWGITTDEWTFVIDADGRVAARFEAFVTQQELEASLLAVLDDAS
jgi:hypothetical protein